MLLTETRELQENQEEKEPLVNLENLETRENQEKLQILSVHHLVIRWVFEVVGKLLGLELGFRRIHAVGPSV